MEAGCAESQIQDSAREIVSQNPGGIRYGKLVDQIAKMSPDTPRNSIHGAVWNLATRYPTEIMKPSRGLYKPAKVTTTPVVTHPVTRTYEADFYEPFSDWLKNDLDEVSDAAVLGGAGMREKWGTPDVVGVYKPLASNLIKFPIEIVSAEIKADPQGPVVAFGQAVAYRLFSAKTYVVMPYSLTEEDESRLEALCMLFGVGLVLFEPNVENPKFAIRVRAQRFPPDMFYVNEFAERLKQADPEKFEKLFR